MHLNSQARIFVFVFSLIIFALAIESIPHSIHHISERQRGKSEKSCPFFNLWLQNTSSTVPDFSISVLINNHLTDYLFPLNENPLIEFYIDSALLIRSPPILG